MQEEKREPDTPTGAIKGVLFDLDGTFYAQSPLRLLMSGTLLGRYFYRPGELLRRAKVIKAYRRSQEIIRNAATTSGRAPKEQIRMTVRSSGETEEYVRDTVGTWFERIPLWFLPLCRRRGMRTVIRELSQKGLSLGVLSDYPAVEKLRVLGVYDYFPVVVTPDDPEVNGFKPHGNGFHVAAKKMGLRPAEILYIGDRPEIDGYGASQVGMVVRIITPSKEYPTITTFFDLVDIVQSYH